jgi:hypothetical protein
LRQQNRQIETHNDKYEIEQIFGKRGSECFVLWSNYDEPTWEPVKNLQHLNIYKKWKSNYEEDNSEEEEEEESEEDGEEDSEQEEEEESEEDSKEDSEQEKEEESEDSEEDSEEEEGETKKMRLRREEKEEKISDKEESGETEGSSCEDSPKKKRKSFFWKDLNTIQSEFRKKQRVL